MNKLNKAQEKEDFEDIIVERLRAGGTKAVAEYIYNLKCFVIKNELAKQKKDLVEKLEKISKHIIVPGKKPEAVVYLDQAKKTLKEK